MKNLIVAILLAPLTFSVSAQKFDTPVQYLEYIGKEFKSIQAATWDYTKSVAKNKSAKKVDKNRRELIQTISVSINRVKSLQDFKGETWLRDTALNFLELNKIVVSEDYEKIMNLEDIAEQSYDLMEAYLAAKEIAGAKLESAGERIEAAERKFAEQNNIKLVESTDKTTLKLKQAGIVYDYYNPIFLIFFKSYKQEAYLIDAMSKGDVSGMEQNNKTLAQFANDGLKSMETIKAFNGDISLKNACVNLLRFQKEEAEKKMPVLINFYTKKEGFEKTKKAFEAKKEKDRTKEDVDNYNKMINEYNKASTEFNTVNQELNNSRTKLLNEWNNAAANFTNKHIN